MPKMPCLVCGVPNNSSRCEVCQNQYAMDKALFSPRVRASASSRGYDNDWKKIRERVLARDGMVCNYCQRVMTPSIATVDHIVPLSKGGARLDPLNLISCCRSCNSRKKDKIFQA